MRSGIGVGDRGQGRHVPPPKIREKIFSGNYYVKFGNVNFSGKSNSNFIMKCDKRTQNVESSVRTTVQKKNIKKHVNTNILAN